MSETKKITVEVEVEVPAELEFERKAEWRVPESLEPWADTKGTIFRGPTISNSPRLILTPKPSYADQVREWWPEWLTEPECVATDEDGEVYFHASEPEPGNRCWSGSVSWSQLEALEQFANLPPFPKCDNWRESKVMNPYKQENG